MRFGIGAYGVVFSIDDQIVFHNNGKIITAEEEVNNKRVELIGILSSVVIVRLLLTSGDFDRRSQTRMSVLSASGQLIKILKKQEEEGLTLGEHGLPNIDIILQISKELNKLMECETYVSWGTNRKEKSEACQA